MVNVNRKRIEVVAAVIEDCGQIFATQRGYGEFKDMWEFPGGKMEPGESREEALRREIREELDTEIAVGKLLCTVEYHESARWLSADGLESVDWLPADLQILPLIKECL